MTVTQADWQQAPSLNFLSEGKRTLTSHVFVNATQLKTQKLASQGIAKVTQHRAMKVAVFDQTRHSILKGVLT
ncbi:hypothetical protein D210916BOD24_14100 [Alteromonas sp. D210916BOD_24]